MEKLRDGRLLDRFFATTRAKLREISQRLGIRRRVNPADRLADMTFNRIELMPVNCIAAG